MPPCSIPSLSPSRFGTHKYINRSGRKLIAVVPHTHIYHHTSEKPESLLENSLALQKDQCFIDCVASSLNRLLSLLFARLSIFSASQPVLIVFNFVLFVAAFTSNANRFSSIIIAASASWKTLIAECSV